MRRYVLSLGAAALIGTAVTVLSGHVSGSGKRAANGARTTAHTSQAPPASHPRRRGSWIAEANAVCRLGPKLYPSIALGANADPDTMDYAVNRLVDEVAAIAGSSPARPLQLARDGRAAGAAWRRLATQPIEDMTARARQEAVLLTARYVDDLVAREARACARLRPLHSSEEDG